MTVSAANTNFRPPHEAQPLEVQFLGSAREFSMGNTKASTSKRAYGGAASSEITRLKRSFNASISDGMDNHDVHGRLSKLEGSSSTQQWAVGVVSASLLAAAGISIAVTIALWGAVSSLSEKVEALPGEIRQELQGLNSAMIEAIQAGREASPAVVIVPQAVPGSTQSVPATPAPETPTE